ncbi:MAG TPA: DUF423 domain-containing protein [Polyangiaceae bacterium]|jgi:uncharacterized membrane protein YgdD (TMEM256/DUF423 family)|nr:DUF423 domain-containing protein [Polyangiaceae bacterium]
MERIFLILSGVFGFLGVALGAFGAHALRAYLEKLPDGAKRAEWWETASRYHLIHALAIAVAAYLAARAPGGASTAAGYCFAGGILLFSGSLYTMTLTGIRVLGAVTPFGGLLMMAGWIAVVIAAL